MHNLQTTDRSLVACIEYQKDILRVYLRSSFSLSTGKIYPCLVSLEKT